MFARCVDPCRTPPIFFSRTGRQTWFAAGHAIWLPPPPNSPTHHPATTSSVCHTTGQLSRWCRRRKRRAWRAGSRGRPKARTSRPTLAFSIVMPQLSNSPHLYHQTHAHSLRNPTWAHSNKIEALQSKLLPPQAAQEGKDDHDPSGMLRPALQESCGVLACPCAHPPPTNPIRHPTPLVTAKCLCLCMSCPVVSAALAFSRGTYVRIHS